MTFEKRDVAITGNWKMHKTIRDAVVYIKTLAPEVEDIPAKVMLALPFTMISAGAEAAKGTSLLIGAQNAWEADEGAYTGEISCKMLKDAGAVFVIIGHSERRSLFHESDELINKKIRRALKEGLSPTLCVGETMAEKEMGLTETILKRQLIQGLEGIGAEISKVIIAYEPIWAIGTKNAATPDAAESAHLFCREVIAEKWGREAAERILIQYGGSVNGDNAKALLEQPNIDGLLVGGASLSVETFIKIVKSTQTDKIRI